VWLLHSWNDHGDEGIVEQQSQPTEDEIRDYLSGNICRCGTYAEVMAAVKSASEKLAMNLTSPPTAPLNKFGDREFMLNDLSRS